MNRPRTSWRVRGRQVRAGMAAWAGALAWCASAREAPGPAFELDLSELRNVPPERIAWVETAPLRTNLSGLIAVAIGRDDQFAIGAGQEVILGALRPPFTADRRLRGPGTIRALAFAPDGTLWIASDRTVWRLARHADTLETGPELSDGSLVTSIAALSNLLAVADAGMKVVWLFDGSGRLLRHIRAVESHGFVVPSPHFDVAFESPTTLWIVNPGELRLEEWSVEGRRLRTWGRPGVRLEGFSGCCNPTDIARLPDARIVTVEKGLVRIKVYSPDGQLEHVVAAPASFAENVKGMDLAVDSRGRIFAADPVRGAVRVFVPKSGATQ